MAKGFHGLTSGGAVTYTAQRSFAFGRHLLRRALSRSEFTRGVRRALRDRSLCPDDVRVYRGAMHDFSNLAEAAARFEHLGETPDAEPSIPDPHSVPAT